MNSPALFLGFIFAASAFAAELPKLPVGDWKFDGTFRESQIQATERVYLGSDQGRSRAADLKTQGYVCNPPTGSWTLCRTFLADLPASIEARVPAAVARHVSDLVGDDGIRFDGRNIQIEIVTEAPSLTEFHVVQSVNVAGSEITDYEYYRLTPPRGPAVEKMKLRDDLWLLAGGDLASLEVPVSISFSSGNRTWSVLALARFARGIRR
jgi:hypothetical protein